MGPVLFVMIQGSPTSCSERRGGRRSWAMIIHRLMLLSRKYWPLETKTMAQGFHIGWLLFVSLFSPFQWFQQCLIVGIDLLLIIFLLVVAVKVLWALKKRKTRKKIWAWLSALLASLKKKILFVDSFYGVQRDSLTRNLPMLTARKRACITYWCPD